MFGFKKKERNGEEPLAAVDGTLILIEDVKDPVFSQKMMRSGFAIASTGDTVYAYADAGITTLSPSNHATGLTSKNGIEILIRVGINTVNESENGFTCSYEQGKHVKKSEPPLKMDHKYLLSKEYDLSVIIILTNEDSYAEFRGEELVEVKGGGSIAAIYTLPQKRGGLQTASLQGAQKGRCDFIVHQQNHSFSIFIYTDSVIQQLYSSCVVFHLAFTGLFRFIGNALENRGYRFCASYV